MISSPAITAMILLSAAWEETSSLVRQEATPLREAMAMMPCTAMALIKLLNLTILSIPPGRSATRMGT